MRRRSAGARHLVWLVALVAALVLPLWSAWSPLPVRVLPAAAPARIAAPSVVEPGTAGSLPAQVTRQAPSERANAAPGSRPLGVGTLCLVIWALGVVVLLTRLVLGGWVVRGIVRRARHLEEGDWEAPLYEIADRLGLDQAPQLLQSHRVKMPFATGFLKAVIVL